VVYRGSLPYRPMTGQGRFCRIPKGFEGSKGCILLISTLASFLPAFMGSSINIALPTIGREFSMDAVLLSWVATAYLLSLAIFQLPFGRMADIYGRKRIFLLGISIFTVFSLLSAIAISPEMLIAFRFLHGVGSAMIFSTGVAILTAVFPPGERGRALGINVTAVYLGISLGPVLGGILTQYLTWRSIFLVNVPLGLAVIALVIKELGDLEWTEAGGEGVDLPGLAVYAASLSALIYGLSIMPAKEGLTLIIASLAGILLFLRMEERTKSPLLDVALFRKNRVFALSNLAALINYSATFAVTFLLSIYLQSVKGLEPHWAGMVLVSQPIVQTAFSSSAGALSDRIEPRLVASAGMGITALGLSLLAFIGAETALWYIVLTLVVLGLGFALFSSPNTNAIMSSVEKRHYGLAGGMVGTMRSIGMMISMGMVMVTISSIVGRVAIGPESQLALLEAMRLLFSAFVFLCLAGTAASLARGRMR